MAKIIELKQLNASDSVQSRPRAVVLVFPYNEREIEPKIMINEPAAPAEDRYQSYLNLRNKYIIISDDILSATINTAKGNPNHNLQLSLAPLGLNEMMKDGASTKSNPNTVNYLQKFCPGDWIMCWIVAGTDEQRKLIDKIKKGEATNSYDSGLKFIGQVMNINESFRVSSNGMKTKRFTVSAAGFNQYNSQIFYSPFVGQKANSSSGAYLFVENFYKYLQDNIIQKAYDKKDGGPLNIQKQFKGLHKVLLGPGPGDGNSKEIVRSSNGAFGVPSELAVALGRKLDPSSFRTYADICSVIIGVQQFSEDRDTGEEDDTYGVLGPAFKLETSTSRNGRTYGAYYEPDGNQEDLFLKGRKALRVSPTMGGTIYSLLQQVSNSAINEMYFTLRPEPNKEGNILPTLVCRQLPFADHLIEEIEDFSYTKYFDMPRFKIDPKTALAYDISRSEAMRLNTVMARMTVTSVKPNGGEFLDGMAIANGNWAFDENDIKRHGQRFYPVNIDQDVLALNEAKDVKVVRKYASFVTSIVTNQHLKYTGNLQIVGVHDPICVGENCEFNDIVFHIEGVSHTYQVSEGLPSFRTTLSLSHGIHKSGDYDALNESEAYELFENMAGGIVKEGQFPTEFGSQGNQGGFF